MKLRNILITGLAGIVLLGCNAFSPYKNNDFKIKKEIKLEELTPANKFLYNFPENIPNTKSIRKYLTPDAKKCLIHLRQMHVTKESDSEQLEQVEKVQENIYSIAKFLNEKYLIDVIYDEGITSQTGTLINFLINFSREVKETNSTEKLNALKKDSPDIYKNYILMQDNLKYDGAYKAAIENKMRIGCAENWEIFEKSRDDLEKYKLNSLFRIKTNLKGGIGTLVEQREDYVLKIVNDGGLMTPLVVYGGRHAFGGKQSFSKYFDKNRDSPKDNLYEWNKNNPRNKFSLIEISPDNLMLK